MESEIKLAGQRSHFQMIFDHLPDAVLVLTPKYIVEEANLNFLKRFDKKADEVIGRHCYEVFRNFDAPCNHMGLPCPMAEVVRECFSHQVIQQYSEQDGELRYDEITMSPLCPPEGVKKRYIEVIKDVTPRRRLEEALQASEEETRQLLKKTNISKIFLETIVNGIQDHMMVISFFGGGGFIIGAGLSNGDPSYAHPENFHYQSKMEDIALEVQLTSPEVVGGATYGMWIYDNGDPTPWFWQDHDNVNDPSP